MRRVLGLVAMLAACGTFVGCKPKEQKTPDSMFTKVETKDTKQGTGPAAADGDTVLLTYTGTHANDGVQFDSNDPEGAEGTKIPLATRLGVTAQVIPGMSKGLIGMKAGGEREIDVPWKEGYGAVGSGTNIPPYADLIFKVKMLYIIKKGEENDVVVNDIKVGTGREVVPGDTVTVNYKGRYVNGVLFDDQSVAAKPVSFRVQRDEAISGIDKGIVGMKVGGKRELTIPPAAGWGAAGGKMVIPGDQVLVYEIDLVDAKPGS